MSWASNSIIFVVCDDQRHDGDPGIKLEFSATITAMDALALRGWAYNRVAKVHRCSVCQIRWEREARRRLN